MFLWPKYESRVFRTGEKLARSWDEKVQELGFTVDDRFKWAALGKLVGEYRWAGVRREKAVVMVSAHATASDRRLASPFDTVPDGIYLALYFRMNDANSALADSVERALFGENAECVGRSVRRLGGKARLVA